MTTPKNAAEWLEISAARQKIAAVHAVVERLLRGPTPEQAPVSLAPREPGRDAEVLDIKLHPKKTGLASPDGQSRLLHDLGNIELQAMELAVRTLAEFPLAPREFREQLAEVALDEARHFGLCLDALDELERPWGSWPVHLALWSAVGPQSLLDRVLVVHRYMEGSGLDAGAKILTRLSGVKAPLVRETVATIVREEVAHVAFGSRWYHTLCAAEGVDAAEHFRTTFPLLLRTIPRTEKPALELRRAAGFSEDELSVIECAYAATDFSVPLVSSGTPAPRATP